MHVLPLQQDPGLASTFVLRQTGLDSVLFFLSFPGYRRGAVLEDPRPDPCFLVPGCRSPTVVPAARDCPGQSARLRVTGGCDSAVQGDTGQARVRSVWMVEKSFRKTHGFMYAREFEVHVHK